MGKYNPIGEYLKKSNKKTEHLTYKKIEEILGFKLPKSFYGHRANWANINRPPGNAWIDAGWQVGGVKLGKSITFKQVADKTPKKKATPVSPVKKESVKVKKTRQKKALNEPSIPKQKPVVKAEPISEYIPKLIKDLHELRLYGIITENEFKEKKSELLKRV
ncbi:MAG: hypothetical protein Q7J68_02805 [Thermoplasmata archaeon]|nr:hypothetical protein [Thermoplasmata archaeon]